MLHRLPMIRNQSLNDYQLEMHWYVTHKKHSVKTTFLCLISQKLLQDTTEEVQNYILEQKVQLEAKTQILNKPKVLKDRVNKF